jgi:colicin import membrane protein
VKPKPPTRPKPEKETEAKETPKPEKVEKPKKRLEVDEVAKLLDSRKAQEKPAKPESHEGETAEKSVKGAKPKSGDESAPKSKFDAADISKLLSREAPQRRAATADQIRTASIGAPEGSAPKMSASMESRIASYIHDHYHPCWASALSLGGATFAPVVEFHLSRDGALEGRPRLMNPSANSVEQARGEQAVQAVRRCSPMRIPPEFMPYYEEALHDVTIRFQDAN